jgi:hypothetical protein
MSSGRTFPERARPVRHIEARRGIPADAFLVVVVRVRTQLTQSTARHDTMLESDLKIGVKRLTEYH